MVHGFMIRSDAGEIKLIKISHKGDKRAAESQLTTRPGIAVVEYLGTGSRRELAFLADKYLLERGLRKSDVGYSGQSVGVHA